MTNVRKTALRLLLDWEAEDRFINLSLTPSLKEGLSAEDRRFLTALLYGTVERMLTLDYCIGRLTKREAASLAPHTRALLRLGLYQILYMEGVPDHAAVSETVALASHKGERGFVNAVLRTATRERETLVPPLREKNPLRHLSVKYSVPLPLVRIFCAQYGEEEAEKLLDAFSTAAPLTLRVNTARISRAELKEKLAVQDPDIRETPFAPAGLRLSGSADPTSLFGFAEGHFYVQDEASQIAVAALDAGCIEKDGLIIDTCACPGGKSFGAAIDLDGCGQVLSFDLHESKLPLIRSGAERLGLACITAAVRDGQEPDPALFGKADRVFCDAPCSGLGVIGKKPDLRYRPAEGIENLPALQTKLLHAASLYTKKGGILIYSTCTLNEAENGGVCREFLKNHPEYAAEDFTVGTLSSTEGMLTLLPHVHHTDGFFIAKFRRL